MSCSVKGTGGKKQKKRFLTTYIPPLRPQDTRRKSLAESIATMAPPKNVDLVISTFTSEPCRELVNQVCLEANISFIDAYVTADSVSNVDGRKLRLMHRISLKHYTM